jgi:hypothetical protein
MAALALTILVTMPGDRIPRDAIADAPIGGVLLRAGGIVQAKALDVFGGAMRSLVPFRTVEPREKERIKLSFHTARGVPDAEMEKRMLDLVNDERVQRGLPSLAWDDRLLFIHCTVVVIGFVAVVQWDALFPDRRDYQILTPLPLPARLIFLSKLCSILLLLMIFWAAGNLGVSVLFPLVSLKSGGLAILAVHAGAQLASTLAAGAFVFLVLASVQGLLLNLLSPKWFRRASVYAQLVAMLLLVFSFLATPVLIGGAAASIRGNPGWTYY